MAEIICVIGNKGGTGKTTIAHMLCQGFGLLGQKSVYVLTDISRQPLSKAGRRYATLDARETNVLTKVEEKLHRMPEWLGVIDGGGNRPETDEVLHRMANLVILPFRDSHEDLRTVLTDLDKFPNAVGLPSQWPTNKWQQDAALKNIEHLLDPHRHRLLKPLYAQSATKLLLQEPPPDSLPTSVNNACRALAWQVLETLGLSLHRT